MYMYNVCVYALKSQTYTRKDESRQICIFNPNESLACAFKTVNLECSVLLYQNIYHDKINFISRNIKVNLFPRLVQLKPNIYI